MPIVDSGVHLDSERILKIGYTVNLLPHVCRYIQGDTMHNPDVDIMGILMNSEDFEIFNTEPVDQFVRFKWNNIGFRF